MRLDFCALCGAKDHTALEHHHYRPKVLGGTDDEKNILTLCGECHGEVHDIPRPMQLSTLVIAGQEKAKERCAHEWQDIADRSARRAERAAEAARQVTMAAAAAERAAIRAEMPTKCRARDCTNTIEPHPTGRRKAFCSDACRIRAHRRYESPKTATGDTAVRRTDLNAPAPVSGKNASFVTSKINGLANPKDRASEEKPDRWIVETELGRWRDWERIESADGVVSYATFVGKDVVAKCGFGKLAGFRDLGLLNKPELP